MVQPYATLASAFIGAVAAAPGCELVRSGPEFLDILLDTVRRANARGNPMSDARIAALCRSAARGMA